MKALDVGVFKRVSYQLDDVKGICVIAEESISSGELVETCATLAISPQQTHLTDQTPLYHIVYTAQDGRSDLVVFGSGSLFNHNANANLTYQSFMEHDRHFVRFIATKNVIAGEELTINYYDDTANEPNFNLIYDPKKSR